MSRRLRCLLSASVVVGLALAACGGDGEDVGATRADQVRDAARKAGLADDVADLLSLAARADTATFQVSYPGSEGARTVISQAPPERRIDVFAGDALVSSRVLHDGVAYRCEESTASTNPGDPIPCQRAAGALDPTGTFTPESLDAFTQQLVATKDTLAVTIDHQQVAGIDTTCITVTPKAGTPIDGNGPGTEELCLSPDGVALLIDRGGQRQVADRYTTTVPKGTFDV